MSLLHHIRDAGIAAIYARYKSAFQEVDPRQSLKIFVHYPPQFYHFHVHFTSTNVQIGTGTERAHLLDDIIDNLSRDSDYYATRNLTCCLGETDKLYLAFQ